MGKSLKNAVTPDEICAEYGADTLRLYEMAMGPLDVSRPWDTRAVVGSVPAAAAAVAQRRRRGRPARYGRRHAEPTRTTLRGAAQGDRRGRAGDMAGLRFNTAIAKLIELNNHLTKAGGPVPRAVAEPLVLLIAPLAPHIAEELWRRLGHTDSLAYADFPVADPALLVAETVTCLVQVNGKVRGRIEVPAGAAEDEVRAAALAAVAEELAGKEPRKVIVVKGRMVSVVA